MKKTIFLLLAILALAIAGCSPAAPLEAAESQEDHSDDDMHEQGDEASHDDDHESNTQEASESEEAQDAEQDDEVELFVVTGENFKFVMNGEDNPTLTVEQGETVRVEFTSTSGFHDFVIDEFDAQTQQVRPGDGVTIVEFVADQKGTFEYYCSVGSHRVQGMKGNFIVE